MSLESTEVYAIANAIAKSNGHPDPVGYANLVVGHFQADNPIIALPHDEAPAPTEDAVVTPATVEDDSPNAEPPAATE